MSVLRLAVAHGDGGRYMTYRMTVRIKGWIFEDGTVVKLDPRLPDFRCPGILWCSKHERHYDECNGCGACRA